MEWMSRLMLGAAEFSALAGRDKEVRQFLRGLATVARLITLWHSLSIFFCLSMSERRK
jgi:hypothetical protein